MKLFLTENFVVLYEANCDVSRLQNKVNESLSVRWMYVTAKKKQFYTSSAET